MTEFRRLIVATALAFTVFVPAMPARAGLDLDNQNTIEIKALDLNHDGRVSRVEVGEYLFFYFDHDGNESLTNGEYRRRRDVSVVPYEGTEINVIDIDNDGFDDGVAYTTDSFLKKAMIGDYDPDDDGIRAKDVIDTGFLRLDTDDNRAIELDEWQRAYGKHAVIKPNQPPKAASQDRYN